MNNLPSTLDQVIAFIAVTVGGLYVLKFIVPYIVEAVGKKNTELDARIKTVESKLETTIKEIDSKIDNTNQVIVNKLDGIINILNESKIKQAILENDVENIKREINEIKKKLDK